MKNKGGRSKKASYATVVIRIPQPLQEEVHRMVEQFHASLNTNKPVTGIEERTINKPVTGIKKEATNIPVTGIEEGDASKLVTGIEALKLPTRIFNILRKIDLNTVGDLLDYTEDDLFEIRGYSI